MQCKPCLKKLEVMFFFVFVLFVSLSFRSYKIYQRHTKKTKQTSILILVFFSLFLLSMSGGVLVQYCFYVTVRLSWWQLPLSCNPAPVVVVSLAVVACACPVSFLRLDVFFLSFLLLRLAQEVKLVLVFETCLTNEESCCKVLCAVVFHGLVNSLLSHVQSELVVTLATVAKVVSLSHFK